MNAEKLVNEVNRKLNGEYEEIVFESDDWNTIVSSLNENIDLYNKSANWRTSYNTMYSVGTVGDSEYYTLDYDEINSIDGSNRSHVIFYDINNNVVDRYKLVGQDIFDISSLQDKVVTININGLQIKPKVETDRIYGCNIVMPVFTKVLPITLSTDTPLLDDQYWLIAKTTADLASTSPVAFISRNFDSLNTDADKRMKAMKKENRISQASTPAVGNWCPSTRPDGR